MKVGLSCIGYECAEHLDAVLAPWLSCSEHEIIISVAHGIFPETACFGYPIFSTDETIPKLQALANNGKIHFQIAETPTFERDLRNITLPPLMEKEPDVIWLLDLQDEIYTPEEISNIIKFINKNGEFDWFKINFKNYVFNTHTFIDDFVAPRIWRTDRNGGIAGFYYDNEMIFKNGELQSAFLNTTVPLDLAFPKHLSWVGSKEYLKRKVKFQHQHYGHCSYRWNEELNRLEFDYSYYSKLNKPLPPIYHE